MAPNFPASGMPPARKMSGWHFFAAENFYGFLL
jgi:hypothetical protein